PRRDAPPARHGCRRDHDRPDRGAAVGAGRPWPVGRAVIATGRRPLDLDGPEAARLYRALVLPRLIEERMLTLLRQGKLSKWFSGIGQEAVSVGLVSALHDDDWVLPAHRNLGVWTPRGVDLQLLFRQLLG